MLSTLHAELGMIGLLAAAAVVTLTMLAWMPAIAGTVTSKIHPAVKLGLIVLLGLFPPFAPVVFGGLTMARRRRARRKKDNR